MRRKRKRDDDECVAAVEEVTLRGTPAATAARAAPSPHASVHDDIPEEPALGVRDEAPWALPRAAFEALARADDEGGVRSTLAASARLRSVVAFVDRADDRPAALEAAMRDDADFERFAERCLDIIVRTKV